MSLGQLFFIGISGNHLTDDEKKFIESEDIGGVILFSKNYESPAQLAELVNSIQQLRKEYPLFIGVDHEGGRVIRFKTSFTQFPPMLNLCRLNSPKILFNTYKIMAEELVSCGINVNFSPVCDILNNNNNKVIGDRAHGYSGEDASQYVTAGIRGLQTNGVLACAKHFPGHGATIKDSHFDLPYITTPLEQLENNELIPFLKAVKARVAFMMMGHLVVDAFDKEYPCSLSLNAHEYLRKKFKYSGIIISDDMQMQAVTDKFDRFDAAQMAIEAGTNMLIYRDFNYAVDVYHELKKRIQIKKISKDIINKHTMLIMKHKKKYFESYRPIFIPDIASQINKESTRVLVEEINRKMAQQE